MVRELLTLMQPIQPKQRRWSLFLSPAIRRLSIRLSLFALLALGGSGCDLVSKAWAEKTLAKLPGHTLSVADPWLDFSLTYNRGTAFSFIGDLGEARWVLGLVALLLVVGLAIWVATSTRHKIEALALGALAGGALGNGYDRVFRAAPEGGTGVVDFIKLNYPWGGSWPTFNIADALLFCGIAAIFLHMLIVRRKPVPEPAG